MAEKKKYAPPESDKDEIIHASTRGLLGSIPFFGSGLTEAFTFIITSPLESRRDEWRKQVGEALLRLEESIGISLEDLRNDDEFIDLVLHASQIAMRTSVEVKREALKNAIINSAAEGSLKQSHQHLYINFIDEFTEWHLRILKLFQKGGHIFQEYKLDMSNFKISKYFKKIEETYPELKNQKEFYDQVWKDLYFRGLISVITVHGKTSSLILSETERSVLLEDRKGLYAIGISTFGEKFIKFITETGDKTTKVDRSDIAEE